MMKALDPQKEMFKGLGKATMRGVRKCPSCGTLNGIRSLGCKNKSCNMVFRGHGRKPGHSADAVEIITGSTAQVFSVRLRDRGPDYRGFVEFPMHNALLNADLRGSQSMQVEPNLIVQVAQCHVEACQKHVELPVTDDNACPHIQHALKCENKASPLTLKNSVLNSLPISNEMKQAIWMLATETTGPLVQRVSKNVMVVKCKGQSKHKLGFLHLTFPEGRKRKDGVTQGKFQCACRTFRSTGKLGIAEDQKKRCVHYYACICAFVSDGALSKEFEQFINLEPIEIPVQITLNLDGELIHTLPSEDEVTASSSIGRKRRKDDSLAQASSALLTLQEGGTSPGKKTTVKRHAVVSSIPNPKAELDETQPTITFKDWLCSVTEKINQTMHFQFNGSPETLVFHVPEVFFECLQQRISSGFRKKRLPNSTTAFIRKDALPLGTFTKYTWHLTNIQQVQRIFDTPEVPLEVQKLFVENKDGSYTHQESKREELESYAETYRKLGQKPIKPFELKTFLKVGTLPGETKQDSTPFIIEWIPDILPKMHIGELRIRFEYGHVKNGKRVHAPTSASQTPPNLTTAATS
ncbi:uncharacterized protein C2orf42-like [Apostichopus japonicus]|uniref:uncharacterized protein C2orf42-like n=1 Tax=Stichopus japonicus TaxID=307972 RepID=UPI003AB6E7C3